MKNPDSRWCDGALKPALNSFKGKHSVNVICPVCGREVRTTFIGAGRQKRVVSRHLHKDASPGMRRADDGLNAVKLVEQRVKCWERDRVASPFSPDVERLLPTSFWNPKRALFIRYMRGVMNDANAKAVYYQDLGLIQLMARGQIGVSDNTQDAWDRLMENLRYAASIEVEGYGLRTWLALLQLSQGAKGRLDINRS